MGLGVRVGVSALGVGGGLHQNVHGLLEGATHERARLDAIDAVSRDGEDVPAVSHHVAQHGEVAIVDVAAVELDDGA